MLKSKLKILLAQHDTNQRQLAAKLDIREATLNSMANNKIKQIPVDIICKICDEFDCNVNDLMEYIPDDINS